MSAEDRAILQEVGVMDRGRAEDSGQDKTVLGINSRVLLEPEVRRFVFDGPVAFQIARELQRITILILLAFISIAMRTFFSIHHCSWGGWPIPPDGRPRQRPR